MPTPLEILYEDVATGKTKPITTPIRLSDIGKIPTVRVNTTDPTVKGMGYRLRFNGKSVPGIPDWEDKNFGWRLVLGDKAAPLPVGTSWLSVYPIGANGKPIDAGVTVKLTVLAESLIPPVVIKPPTPPVVIDHDPTPPSKPDTDGTPPPVVVKPTVLWGLHDAANRVYDAMLIPAWVKGAAVWWTPDWQHYARDNDFANAMTYARAGKTIHWRVAQAPVKSSEALKYAAAWFLAATTDLVKAYDADPATFGATVHLEIFNEIDQLAYYTGTLDEYVAIVKAIHDAVKPVHGDRVKLYSAGYSWDIAELEKLAPKLASFVDGLCFHGYPKKLDAAGMDGITRFGALCIELGKLGVLSEAAPACAGIADEDIPGRSAKYISNVNSTPGITAAYWFAATPGITSSRPKGYTNGRGAPFDMQWQLTASGKAIAGAVG